MKPCDLCTGTRYLADIEANGACLCVTPEAMRELEDVMGDAGEALRRYFLRIGLGSNPVTIDDPDLRDAWDALT